MNLKWYYTKILKGEGMTKKENAPTPGTDAALYEAVKNKIAEEVPEAKVILNQLPQASGTKGTKEITPEDAKKSRTPPKKCRQSWKNRLPAKSSAPYWNIRMNCRQRPSSSLKKSRTETTPRKSWTS